jgi:tetratricopeptide (TPR) repeat protein
VIIFNYKPRTYPWLILPFLVILAGCQPAEITSAKLYSRSGEWDAAFAQLQLAVEKYPENAEAHYLLGRAYLGKARYREMRLEFEKSMQLSDKFDKAILKETEHIWIQKHNAGVVAMEREDYKGAEQAFATAMVIAPDQTDTKEKMAMVYINTGRLEEALVLYNQLYKENTDDLGILISIGNLYYNLKQYDMVIVALQRILEIDPQHPDALANLALTYHSLGRVEDADAAFQKAIVANPHDKDLTIIYGIHQYHMKRYEQAIELFERVLAVEPGNFECTSNIGNAYLSLAKSYRLQLHDAGERDVPADRIRQLRNLSLLNYKRAISYIERALSIQPNHAGLWRNLGVAYIATGDKSKGTRAFLKSEEVQLQRSKKKKAS